MPPGLFLILNERYECTRKYKNRQGYQIDHRDGNGLNNTRDNLRHVTVRQNQQNRRNINKSSIYPGVCRIKNSGKWCATICINGKNKRLGNYNTEREAFNAYLKALNEINEAIVDNKFAI